MAKTNPTKKQIDAEIQAFETWASMKTQSLSLQIGKTGLNCKLQLLASEYQQQSPGGVLGKKVFLKILHNSQKNTYAKVLFSMVNLLFISLRFLLLTLSMYLFAGRGREKQWLLLESLKYVTQQTNTYIKLATVTLH